MPKGGVGGQRRVKDPPWKMESNMKRFTQAEMRKQARAEAADKVGGAGVDYHAHKMHPDWRTTNTDAFGPAQSSVLLKERAKRLAALDECVVKNWTTTHDNIGASERTFAEGRAEAKAILTQKRSKCNYQTHEPWTTTYDAIGQNRAEAIAPVVSPKKKTTKTVKYYFPKEIDYRTTQEDYGNQMVEYKRDKAKTLRPGKAQPVDIYKTSNTYGHQISDRFAPDRNARTRELREEIENTRAAMAHEQDVLGPVNPSKEEQAFLRAYKENMQAQTRSKMCSNFMVSDIDKPPPVHKEGPNIEDMPQFSKATSYRIRKGLAALNIDPEDL